MKHFFLSNFNKIKSLRLALNPIKKQISVYSVVGCRKKRSGPRSGIFFLLCVVTVLAVCGSASEARTVRVGLYQNKPKVFVDESGHASGIFVDILNEIAKREGWTLSYVRCEWSECLHALEEGRIDLMPDVAYSQVRDEKYDFHKVPVADSWSQVYSRHGVPISRLSDLDGRRIALLEDSIQQASLKQTVNGYGYDITVVSVKSFENAFKLVRDGSADAAITNHFFGDYLYQDYGLEKTPIVLNVVSLFYATAEGRNSDLLEAIDRDLDIFIKEPNSVYYKSLSRWSEKPAKRVVPRYFFWVIGLIGGLLIFAFGFIQLLRRQVAVKTKNLMQANEELKNHRENLEKLVAERTSELEVKNQQLISYIAERKQAEVALIESEERYRVLFESSQDAIMTLAPPLWKFTKANSATLKMFGAKNESEFASLSPWELSPEKQADGRSSQDKAKEMIEIAMRDGSNYFEWTHKKLNDEEFSATVLLTRAVIGEETMLQATVRDISGQKRIEESLKRSEEQFRLAFESTKDAIFWADADTGIIIKCNKSAERLLERPREEIVGQHHKILHPPNNISMHEEMFKNHVDQNGAKDAEAEIITKSGKTVPVHISSTVVSIAGRKINQGMFRDVSDIKRAQTEKETLQAQLHQSQKMEAIGQLSGGIAHDFNNILAVIIGTADQVMKDLPETGPSRKHMDRISRVAKRAKDLTLNLLTFARKEKLHVRSIQTDDLIQELVDLLKRSLSKKVRINTNCSNSMFPICVDANQMVQALLNVCMNAADAMPEGGTLSITCDMVMLEGNECKKLSGIAPGRYSRIIIADTGSGMTDDVKEQLFNPFFTTKERGKGTGLGLTITLGIVQSHGGAISVDSEAGKGTKMVIYLPVVEDQNAVKAKPCFEEIIPAASGTILVIDDDSDFLDMTTEILQSNNFCVIPALGPAMAIELFRKHQTDIELVVLDMVMPEMSGDEVFRVLRQMKSDIKVLVCSGYSKDGRAGQILSEGAIGFLQKPFDSENLLRIVSEILNQ